MAEIRDVPAVALLFADAELAGHLREALTEQGARIVHQGPAADVSADVLSKSGAGVVVVNLEPSDGGHVEHLCTALEGDPCQVIFNDAEASRNLSGWDKARWARHLAAKLVGSDNVDPPRPGQARTTQPATAAAVAEPTSAADPAAAADASTAAGTAPASAEPISLSQPDTQAVVTEATQPEQFEAELEALLADNASSDDATSPDDAEQMTVDFAAPAPAPESADDAPLHSVDIEERQTVNAPEPAFDWELVDMDAAPPATSEPADPQQFGIEKVSAESYLKPDGDDHDETSSMEPGMKLELVSLEESVAPTMSDVTNNDRLPDTGVEHAVIVGTGSSGVVALEIFLAGLPASLPAVLLLLAPADGPSMDALTATLAGSSALPVAMARDDSQVAHGSVLLVPPGHTCRLGRDGQLRLAASEATVGVPVVEQCLVNAADSLASGVTAIVLAGTDHGAVAGARRVHDQGGQVWIQNPASCAGDPTTTALHDTGLATFVGSPVELVRHLCETSQ